MIESLNKFSELVESVGQSMSILSSSLGFFRTWMSATAYNFFYFAILRKPDKCNLPEIQLLLCHFNISNFSLDNRNEFPGVS